MRVTAVASRSTFASRSRSSTSCVNRRTPTSTCWHLATTRAPAAGNWCFDSSGATLDRRQPWGSLAVGFELSQYLHDPSKYRLEGEGDSNLRLTRGLSLTLSGSASRIRDQLSLPLRDATDEEVLLRIRQLQSGYEVYLSIGVTYSVGLISNSIVNPRFGD